MQRLYRECQEAGYYDARDELADRAERHEAPAEIEELVAQA